MNENELRDETKCANTQCVLHAGHVGVCHWRKSPRVIQLEKAVEQGVATDAEKRELLGLPPVPAPRYELVKALYTRSAVALDAYDETLTSDELFRKVDGRKVVGNGRDENADEDATILFAIVDNRSPRTYNAFNVDCPRCVSPDCQCAKRLSPSVDAEGAE